MLHVIGHDTEDQLVLLLDNVSYFAIATANRSVRCRFAQCLVRLFVSQVEFLEKGGFLYCKHFMQYGGFNVKIKCGQIDERQNPKIKVAMFPIDILEITDFYDLCCLFDFIDCVPNFVGAILHELFARLQGSAPQTDDSSPQGASSETRLLRIREQFAHSISRWQASLAKDEGRLSPTAVHARIANVICAVPVKDAVSCGLAEWFTRLTRQSILDPVCSSTDLFLSVLEQHHRRHNVCIEFINILATVGHCGLFSDVVRRMFEACMSAIIEYSDNVSIYAFDTGVTLTEVLSALAKIPCRLWQRRGKHHCFQKIMEKAREYDDRDLEDDGSHNHYLMAEQILLCGRVAALPKSGLDRHDMEFLNMYREGLLQRSLSVAGKHVVLEHRKAWDAQIVRACLRMEPSRLSDIAIELGARQTDIDEMKKIGWIQTFLSGVMRTLEENVDTITVLAERDQDRDEMSYVLFSDKYARELRDICSTHPYIRYTLERFELHILSLRDGRGLD